MKVTDARAQSVDDLRRQELGEFLRSRRERLSPQAAGLPAGFRRRTPGLRREEVALLSGMGITWYTWLEQGREVRPSAQLLSALAAALQLDVMERRHLSQLTGGALPEPLPAELEEVPAALQRMLASLRTQPAYVLGRRWDVLAWNSGAQILFGDYGRLGKDDRNILHLLFIDPAHRQLLVDWSDLARTTLAMFRADCARYAGEPAFEQLKERLMQASPEFRGWWAEHEVQSPLSGRKRLMHPQAGNMTFEYTHLSVAGHPGLKFVVYTPMDDDDSAAKLASLLRAHPDSAAALTA